MSISVIADSILSTEGETGRERGEQWREVKWGKRRVALYMDTYSTGTDMKHYITENMTSDKD